MSDAGKTLIAGIGNIFLGDDGFGVEVARRLAAESWPSNVEVADIGIRGMHLAYDLLDGYRRLILVDAASRGFAPGTVFVLEPGPPSADAPPPAHSVDPASVLGMLEKLGGEVDRVWLVGCEPKCLDEGMDLSPEVEAAIPEAMRAVRELVERPSSMLSRA